MPEDREPTVTGTPDAGGPQVATDRFPSYDPATGEVLATWPVDDEASVREAVDRARVAAQWWADLGPVGRRERLLAWKGVVTRRIRRLAWQVHRENGKPAEDAVLETVAAIEHIDWAARHAAPGPGAAPGHAAACCR